MQRIEENSRMGKTRDHVRIDKKKDRNWKVLIEPQKIKRWLEYTERPDK